MIKQELSHFRPVTSGCVAVSYTGVWAVLNFENPSQLPHAINKFKQAFVNSAL